MTCSKSIQSLLKQFKTWHPPPLRGKRLTTKNNTITTFGLILNAKNINVRQTNLQKKHYKIPNQENRDNYFTQRKTYRALLKRKKRKFFATLHRNINQERNINWEGFKKLKSFNKRSDDMDLEDLATFFSFFKDLYSKKALPSDTIKNMETAYNVSRTTSKPIQILTEVLDKDITLSELEGSIAKLKNGKAVAEDGIMKESIEFYRINLRLYPW